jgi:hypothetical protein
LVSGRLAAGGWPAYNRPSFAAETLDLLLAKQYETGVAMTVESALHAHVVMMDEAIVRSGPARMDRLFQSAQHEDGGDAGADAAGCLS